MTHQTIHLVYPERFMFMGIFIPHFEFITARLGTKHVFHQIYQSLWLVSSLGAFNYTTLSCRVHVSAPSTLLYCGTKNSLTMPFIAYALEILPSFNIPMSYVCVFRDLRSFRFGP